MTTTAQLSELEATYAAVTSPILSDSLDALGCRGRVMDARIRPLQPDARVVGRAATVQYAPHEEDADEPYDDIISFIDTLTPGSVAVVAAEGSERAALWGELFSAAAIGRQAAGLVCDGLLRDTPGIRKLDFAAFSAGSCPLDLRARMRVVAVGEPVSCAGVRVEPGELVLADSDGVVVVPRDLEARVQERATQRATGESTVLHQLLAGTTLRAVWDEHRIL